MTKPRLGGASLIWLALSRPRGASRKIDIGLELFSLLGADRECPLPIKGRDSAVANFAMPRVGAALFHCPLLRACP